MRLNCKRVRSIIHFTSLFTKKGMKSAISGDETMDRVYNFAAGPAAMPLPVLERAAKEMTCYASSGMSVMEMSHRSSMYLEIFQETEAVFRELMKVPENYSPAFYLLPCTIFHHI